MSFRRAAGQRRADHPRPETVDAVIASARGVKVFGSYYRNAYVDIGPRLLEGRLRRYDKKAPKLIFYEFICLLITVFKRHQEQIKKIFG